jgi:hypothetical protein
MKSRQTVVFSLRFLFVCHFMPFDPTDFRTVCILSFYTTIVNVVSNRKLPAALAVGSVLSGSSLTSTRR